VAERIRTWNNFENLSRDVAAYFAARKTFNELMEEGRALYGAGEYTDAIFRFSDARELRPNHYAPYYYMGLIYYGNEGYSWAEQNYNRSLELGADKALVYYALGLNAAAEGLIEKAAILLRNAAEADPARYREKAGAVLKAYGLVL
jgi:tetratricopeptide (TPR) repeat protein